MKAKDDLDVIANEIHRTIVATVDDEGLPVTAAIDLSVRKAAPDEAFDIMKAVMKKRSEKMGV